MRPMRIFKCLRNLILAGVISCLWSSVSGAQSPLALSKGQTIYVPIYSHVYGGDRESPFYLTTMLSIRNTDPGRTITVLSADYYDSDGKLLSRHAASPAAVGPIGSIRYVIKESDKAGGSGASFVVKWKSDQPVNPPIVESIMIGTRNQQGVSFTSRGQVIE
jgi:Protein of unknown function (DUF3124)